ncbi:MAG TPA: hypothetical protein VEC35_08670 [Noviherbaspirillum sp.]|nr:hypothetical protein [Noviherbaspirillum sp.]
MKPWLPMLLAMQTDNLGFCDERGNFQIAGRAQCDANGKVSIVPGERTVGPMGDKRIFRFLEAYANFSIRFKSGLLKPRANGVTCQSVREFCSPIE